ncbi:glycosyltransferase family 2 protein [Caldicellulosiruptor morganii]|uniref:Glycosyltransferase n=1 Tax=Caldicellulosiruptor morganii TaxID=1387555 RepID=A0ABY7BP06_9FIRM|nr:glycosyltransferase family 2 protein [Caldicellulosiruptor morganii]WAM33632.1 glycosyltransferase [Caldicellulosiruptor morganii]
MPIKVSIIVPFYNSQSYLERCITSLIEQDLKEIQIILINDGSCDLSGEIADFYAKKDERILVIHNKVRQGVSIARNIGLKIAKGEYIAFVDSDDWVDKEMYSVLYAIAKDYNADIVISGIIYHAARGRVIKQITQNLEVYNDNRLKKEIIPLLCKDTVIGNSPCNKLYRRTLIEEIGAEFPVDLKQGEDLEFNRLIFPSAHKIVLVPRAFYNYYLLNYSAMRKPIKNYHEVYLRKLNNTISYMQRIGINPIEYQNDLYAEIGKCILRNIQYIYSKGLYNSKKERREALLDLANDKIIKQIIRKILNKKLLHSRINLMVLSNLYKKRFIIPIIYGYIMGMVINPLKWNLRIFIYWILKLDIISRFSKDIVELTR